MRSIIFATLFGVLCACSAPRYQYAFDHYDYHSGRKEAASPMAVVGDATEPLVESPLTMAAPELSASVNAVHPGSIPTPVAELSHPARKSSSLSASEKRSLRQAIRNEVKSGWKKSRLADGARSTETKELDQDLKLAIIFGAIGITLTILGGLNTILWVLGVVGLVVGLVFFIRWIQTQ